MTIEMVRAPVYTGHQAKQGISTVNDKGANNSLWTSGSLISSATFCPILQQLLQCADDIHQKHSSSYMQAKWRKGWRTQTVLLVQHFDDSNVFLPL